MSVGSVGAGAMFALRTAIGAGTPSPEARQGQVNAQADLLQALMGLRMPAIAAARLSDGAGVDLYL
ncbi:hypothetical protein ACIBSW_19810 [Actinoplanes sp. NPDC049668]|uniref:hypothetical protein n=1 Tax=unclassified Actinoplanes TaxID=2626549 RepID=UPI0033B8680B